MTIGILLIIAGLIIFCLGIGLTKKNPGLERNHLAIIVAGLLVLILGGILAYGEFIDFMN